MQKSVILKKGRHKPIVAGHPWIFSGAVDRYTCAFEDAEILAVCDVQGEHIGYGYFRKHGSLIGRMVSWGAMEPYQAMLQNLKRAIAQRYELFGQNVTGYRLINAEGDGFPGLIIDRYGEYLVLQVATLGMERLKPWLVEQLIKELQPKGIYEKSENASRKLERLKPHSGLLRGEIPDQIEIQEGENRFLISVKEGQKTGFFFDQREMRRLVQNYCQNKRVLNAFGFTGSFSVYALRGGAKYVHTVDSSKSALEMAKKNCALNGFEIPDSHFINKDLFDYFANCKEKYDLIILDPPAFAKHVGDYAKAIKAYRELNRLALNCLEKGGILFTASCSYHIDDEAFFRAVQQAVEISGRYAALISRHRLAPDHPIALAHPEGSYLKSCLLQV